MNINGTDEHPTYERDGFKIQLFFELSIQGYISIYPEEGFVWNNVMNREMGYVNSHGYVALAWKYEKRPIHVLAHRLIWWTWYGPIEDHLTINHIDGNKQNNRISNLEKVTYKENVHHAIRMGLVNTQKIGDRLKERSFIHRNKQAKLTDDEVREMRHLYNTDRKTYTQDKLCEMYGIKNISDILNGKSYKWVKDK